MEWTDTVLQPLKARTGCLGRMMTQLQTAPHCVRLQVPLGKTAGRAHALIHLGPANQQDLELPMQMRRKIKSCECEVF